VANIHDPETWGQLDDDVKQALLRIKELLIDDISQFKENTIQEEPENGV
jgi:hypothetical protein